MREEVPAGLLHEHKARVQAAVRMGREVDPAKFGLDELGIVKAEESKKKPVPPHSTGESEEGEQQSKEGPTDSAEKVLEEKQTSSEGAAPDPGSRDEEPQDKAKEPITTSEAEPEKMDTDEAVEGGETGSGDKKTTPPTTTATNSLPPNPDSLGTAAACALAAAATKARHLASVEEKRIKGLVAQLVETQLKKLDIKLKQFQVGISNTLFILLKFTR